MVTVSSIELGGPAARPEIAPAHGAHPREGSEEAAFAVTEWTARATDHDVESGTRQLGPRPLVSAVAAPRTGHVAHTLEVGREPGSRRRITHDLAQGAAARGDHSP